MDQKFSDIVLSKLGQESHDLIESFLSLGMIMNDVKVNYYTNSIIAFRDRLKIIIKDEVNGNFSITIKKGPLTIHKAILKGYDKLDKKEEVLKCIEIFDNNLEKK